MKLIFSLDELQDAARQLWANYPKARVFAFNGDMGAGKTTFIKALCTAKGVNGTTASPTFSIINEYRYKNGDGQERTIYHLDLYRLKNLEEAVEAGVEDCLYHPSAVSFVEWPDVVTDILPADTVHIFLSVTPGQQRQLVAGSAHPGEFRPSLQ